MKSLAFSRQPMRRKLWSVLLPACVGLLSVSQARAEPAAIYEVEFNPATYLEVDLDREIYRYSHDPRLRDVMVMDVEGKELPSRIRTLRPELAENSRQFVLGFFPVLAGEDPSTLLSGGAELRIDDDTVSLRLDPRRVSAGSPAVAPEFYLIDISQLDKNLDLLEIDWLAEDTSRVVSVEVSASNDLRQWRRLAQETLAQLNAEGESLLRNTIRLAIQPEQYDYLRLRFLSGTPVHLQRLTGHHLVQKVAGPPPQRWRVSGSLADDQRPAQANGGGIVRRGSIVAWEFLRDERAPANRISIDLGDTSYGKRLRLYSRNATNQPWQLRHAGIWFNVKVGDQWQQSEALHLGANSDTFWRLELDTTGASAEPQLIFEHPQQRLRFIANNNPPYYITINEHVPFQRTAEEVFASVVDEREVPWQAVSKQLLTEAQPLQIRTGFNWQAVLFWFSLGFAVVLLVFFALRLLRQMDSVK